MLNPYLIGLYLGDGFIAEDHTRKDGSVYYKFSVICSEYNVEEIKSLVPRFFIDYHRECKDNAYHYYSVVTKHQDFCKEMIQYGRKCDEKVIPEGLCKEDFFELLSGLVDSDGTLDSESFNFLSTTENLVDGVIEYLKQFGIEYTKTVRYDKRGYKPVYCLRFSQSTVKKLGLHLRVVYKQDRLEALKKKSRGKVIQVSREWIDINSSLLESLMPKSSYYKLINGTVNHVRDNIYEQIERKLG